MPLLAGIVLQPYFVTLHAADRARSTGPMFTSFVQTCSIAMSAVCLLVAAAGGPLMVRLFGSAYAGTGPLLWPLMACAALAAPALMAWIPLATATQKSYILAVNATSTAIFNMLLHWLLVPRYGPAGAAWAILIASICTAIVTIVCLRREGLPDCVEAIIAALPPSVAAIVALRGGVLVPLLAGVAALAAIALWQRATLATRSARRVAARGGSARLMPDEKVLHVGRPNIGDRERLLRAHRRRCSTAAGSPTTARYVHEFEAARGRVPRRPALRSPCATRPSALEIAIRALGLQGEVIVPSFTFVATAHALQWQGITPVFCDIDPADAQPRPGARRAR